jgi:hypothetical protein
MAPGLFSQQAGATVAGSQVFSGGGPGARSMGRFFKGGLNSFAPSRGGLQAFDGGSEYIHHGLVARLDLSLSLDRGQTCSKNVGKTAQSSEDESAATASDMPRNKVPSSEVDAPPSAPNTFHPAW